MFEHQNGAMFASSAYTVEPPENLTPSVPCTHIYVRAQQKTESYYFHFQQIVPKLLCHAEVISQRDDAYQFEEHGFVCDLPEQSWALKAELRMQCWD